MYKAWIFFLCRYQPFHISKSRIFSFYGGFVLPKEDFVGKREMNRMLRRVVEAGLVDHYLRKYVQPRFLLDSGEEGEPAGVVPFTPEHILGAVFVLAAGLCCAVVAFVREIVVGRSKKCIRK